jgi:trehalose 6-phosphate synthase
MARAIATALSMPLSERRMRWEAMMQKLRGQTIQQWFGDFVDALQEAGAGKAATEPPIEEPPTPWTLRSVNSGARYH